MENVERNHFAPPSAAFVNFSVHRNVGKTGDAFLLIRKPAIFESDDWYLIAYHKQCICLAAASAVVFLRRQFVPTLPLCSTRAHRCFRPRDDPVAICHHRLDTPYGCLLSVDAGQTSNDEQPLHRTETNQPKKDEEREEPQTLRERTLPDGGQSRQTYQDEDHRNNGNTTITTTANGGHDRAGGSLVIHIRSGDIFNPHGQGRIRPDFGQVNVVSRISIRLHHRPGERGRSRPLSLSSVENSVR